MTRFDDYATKCQTIRMERRDGILQMTFHTADGPLQWGSCKHLLMSLLDIEVPTISAINGPATPDA